MKNVFFVASGGDLKKLKTAFKLAGYEVENLTPKTMLGKGFSLGDKNNPTLAIINCDDKSLSKNATPLRGELAKINSQFSASTLVFAIGNNDRTVMNAISESSTRFFPSTNSPDKLVQLSEMLLSFTNP